MYTCFDNRGVQVSTELYTWSQGRWAWLAAELARDARLGRLDLDEQWWRDTALMTTALLLDHAVLDDGSTAFRLDDTGCPLPSGPDGELSTSVFADLFAVLGISGGLRLLEPGDPRRGPWLATALRVLTVADRAIADGRARSEPYPVPEGFTDLAGPMTLVHTAGELLQATPADDPETAGRIRSVRDRALERLLGTDGLLTPTTLAGDDWWELRPTRAGLEATMLARHRTPGHLLELIWMLLRCADQAFGDDRAPGSEADASASTGTATGPVQLIQVARLADLGLAALRLGWDERHGGMLRYTAGPAAQAQGSDPQQPTGQPWPDAERPCPYEQLVHRTWDTKLWWVAAESMYSSRLLAARTGRPELTAWADRIEDHTLATFPDPDGHEWLQIRSRDGSPLDEVVALPVKDPFHIARALLLLNRLDSPTSSQPAGMTRPRLPRSIQ